MKTPIEKNIGGGSERGEKDNKGGRVNWSKELIHLLCDLCIEYAEKSKGRSGAVIGQRLVWKKVESEFKNRTSLPWDKNKLKNKVDWMRTRWSLWKQLKGKETGLGWDHIKGTIDATDEWWTLKIKENSKYEVFREEGIETELECKMDQIFAISAQGKLKYTPVSSSQQKHVMQEVDDVYVPSPIHQSGNDNYGGDNCGAADESWDEVWREISPSHTATPIPSPGDIEIEANDGRKGKRPLVGDFSKSSKAARTSSGKGAGAATIQELLGGMMQTISERNHSTEEITNSMKNMMSLQMDIMKSMKEKSDYNLGDAMAKLCTLSDLTATSPEFFFACTMFEDPQKRTIFFGLPDDNSRVEYIKYMYKEHKKTNS